MMKRMLSLLLVLIMVVGMVPFQVNAQQQSSDVVYVDENTSMEDLEEIGVVQTDPSNKKEPIYLPSTPTTSSQPEDIQAPVIERKPSASNTICDCGMEAADIYHHSDNCALRLHYLTICDGSADLIYDLWCSVGQVTQDFLKDHLSANYPEKLAELYALIEAEEEIEETVTDGLYERLPGEASTTVDGVTFDAQGVPEGSSLTVQEPSKDVLEVVEQIVAEAEDEPEQVFLYDISVQNDESSDWQPEGTSVQMTLTIPGLELNQYTEVRIIHVDDEGNDSLITGVVDADGNIIFETKGFSTFAGFTVEFSYGTALISIPGKTSTTIGTLFEQMKMPLKGSDVVDVQFTNYDVLTVTQEENDWRLTSLQSFISEETLTFTMKDGAVYEFVVTDAVDGTPPYIQTGASGAVREDDNDYVRWFAIGNGILTEGDSVGNFNSQYWAKDKIVYVSGEGSFTFGIAPSPDLARNATSAAVYMKQIRISGGTNVSVEVHSHFKSPGTEYTNRTAWSSMKNVILCSYACDADTQKQSLFQVDEGSLTLKGRDGIKLCLRGSYHKTVNNVTEKTYTTAPLVTLGAGCTSFTATDVTFYNGHDGGIYSKATNLTSIDLTDCTFEDTVYRDGNGGAIYLSAQQESTTAGHRHIGEVNMTRCQFDGNTASSHGGAIFFGDTIGRIRITDCHFTNCKAGRSGGAIVLRGNFGKVSITGSESANVDKDDVDTSKLSIFTGCEAATNGGAISLETVQVNVDGATKEVYTHYGRTNTLNLSGVRFNNCKARGDYTYTENGKTLGNDDGTGGALNLSVEINEIGINHCWFVGCESGGLSTNLGGAGICFGYANLGDTPISSTGGEVQVYGGSPGLKGWAPAASWTEKVDGVEVTRGSDTRTLTMGYELTDNGVTYTRQRTTYGYVRIENSRFVNNKSYQGGAFIVRTGSSIEDLYVNNMTVDGCEATDKGSAVFFNNCTVGTANFVDCNIRNCKVIEAINEGGGTIRTVGQTGTVMTMTRCNFVGNEGRIAGGGIYWNAGANKISVGRYARGMREAPETMITLDDCTFERNSAMADTSKKDQREKKDANGNTIKDAVTGKWELENYKDSAGNDARYSRFGGGIFCETKMVVTGCTFTANRSVMGGGICMGVYNSDYRKFAQDEVTELELDENTVFTYNMATNGGGLAIRANATKAIDNDKEVRHTLRFTLGGARLYYNYANENGGGICYITESYVADPNNPNYNPDLDNAEVRRLIKNITIDDGTIHDNYSGMNGAGIYMNSSYNTTVNVSNGTIYGNYCGYWLGGRSEAGVVATDSGTKDTNGNPIYTYTLDKPYRSDPGGNGGGIYVNGVEAQVNITGGVIGGYWKNGTLTESKNKAYGRSAQLSSGFGGGIAVYGGANVTMSNGYVVYNTADRNGGGIYVSDGAVVTITGGTISNNRANYRDASYLGSGGGIALNECSMTVTNGTIADNSGYNGGGIMLQNSVMIYEGGIIEDNTATTSGGGIYVDGDSNMYLSGGTVQGNSAVNGGGIYVKDASGNANSTDVTKQYGMYVNGGTIQGNSADNGGGVMLSGSTMTINKGTIQNNTATSAGGGIAIHGSSYMYLQGGTVQGNTAVYGGGISVNNSIGDPNNSNEIKRYGMYVDGGTITGNKAVGSTAYGGGICVAGAGTMKVNGGVISGNMATANAEGTSFAFNQQGGGVAVCEGSTLDMAGGSIDGNMAGAGGGLVVRGLSELNMTGTVSVADDGTVTYNGGILNNHAWRYGGGVYLADYKQDEKGVVGNQMTISGGYIYNNLASQSKDGIVGDSQGGGIFVDGNAYMTISGGLIDSNKSHQGSGICAWRGNVTVSNGVMSNNVANRHGGAIYNDYSNVTITGGEFKNNTASAADVKNTDLGKGGAIFNYGTSSWPYTLSVSDGDFTNNTASQTGGAICCEGTGTSEITGGTFTENRAVNTVGMEADGGAVYISNGTATISGGVFENNYTSSSKEANGGAMYITGGTTTISGGDFTSNYSLNYGGGICLESTKVTISDGTFIDNASKNGGGMCIINCSATRTDGHDTIEFTGGDFQNNVADRGGALFIRSSSVTIKDIVVDTNYVKEDSRFGDTDYRRGGGICIDTYGNGPAVVDITGGTFSGNYAYNGGAIWMNNNSDSTENEAILVITGGEFTGNRADNNGGGIWISGGNIATEGNVTKLTMYGGKIGGELTERVSGGNYAKGNGGGIWAGEQAQVNILATETTHGEIDNNSAKNGGGVFVTSGAYLLVEDGYVTNNTAVSPTNAKELSSGYWEVAGNDLHGAGGGVCVTNDLDATVRSTFTLSGDHMAIYGNEATFSGDDVFSNGCYTQLNVPTVVDMDLAGYEFNPEGWFEDYNELDSQYIHGLQMIPKNGGTINGTSDKTEGVHRYRNIDGLSRRYMHIRHAYVVGVQKDSNGNVIETVPEDQWYVNKPNAYVAMTLGIPAAVEDSIVIDYGTKVTLNIWQNDLFMDQADFAETPGVTGGDQHNSLIGREMPDNVEYKDGVYYSKTRSYYGDKYGIYESYFQSGMHGKISNLKNGLISFEPNTLSMEQQDHFFYMVRHRSIWYYAYVTVIPATSIYFEDDLKTIEYHTSELTYDINGNEVYVPLATWTPVGTSTNSSQSQDRPGASILEGLDADNIYGYDPNYSTPPYFGLGDGSGAVEPDSTPTYYSGGSAHKVTVSRHYGVDENGDGKCDVAGCGLAVEFTHDFAGKGTKCTTCLNTKDKHGDDVPEHECSEYMTYNEYCDYCGKWIGTHTTNARATFTFTGTGFDIVGLCSANTGMVMVTVYKGTVQNWDAPWETNEYVASYLVDTYYGYTYNSETGKWEIGNENASTLYQVPAIKADLTKVMIVDDDPATEDVDERQYFNHGYDTYSVEVYIATSFLEREHGYWETDFYLDSIRIYNPAGINGGENQVISDAYKADGEAWPVYQELRNLFIGENEELNDKPTNGKILFIDGSNVPTMEQYKSYGPNNEVYLAKSQGIAFTLNADHYQMDDLLVDGVHIGLRGLTGIGKVQIYSNSTLYKEITLGTTDLYYDISELMGTEVTIKNAGNEAIAITNVKVTHKEKPAEEDMIYNLFSVGTETLTNALAVFTPEMLTDPVLKPKYPALSFDGMICYNVFFSAEDLGDLDGADLGLAVFDSYNPEGTVADAKDVIFGATQIDGLYMVTTNGVHAKCLGDTQYFRAFAKKPDGTYVYSKMVSYSALDYAENVLAKSNDVKLKQLVVAMLNYGAEAQKFFGYNTDDLINKDLTDDQQALISGFSAGSLNAVGKVDASKVGSFASTGGFAKKYPAISFKGAFEINYFMEPSYVVDNDMTLYIWNEDTYNSVGELTADNADKVVTMNVENGLYTASSNEIIAKNLDKTVYVAAVYQADGVSYCSGVLPYSIAAYCQKPSADVAALANAAAVYGCTAKEYFGA